MRDRCSIQSSDHFSSRNTVFSLSSLAPNVPATIPHPSLIGEAGKEGRVVPFTTAIYSRSIFSSFLSFHLFDSRPVSVPFTRPSLSTTQSAMIGEAKEEIALFLSQLQAVPVPYSSPASSSVFCDRTCRPPTPATHPYDCIRP